MQTKNAFLKIAKDFDDVIETLNINQILPLFHENCTIELLEVTLHSHESTRKQLDWMFQYLQSITFDSLLTMVEGDTFFEEFIVNGTLGDGWRVQSIQAEILIYETLLVKHLWLFFNRLAFVKAVISGWLKKKLINKLKTQCTKGLV